MGSQLMETPESMGEWLFFLPIKFIFQQGDQFIRGSKFPFAQVRRNDGVDRLEFFARVGTRVDFRSRQVGVSQPQRDLPDVLGRL